MRLIMTVVAALSMMLMMAIPANAHYSGDYFEAAPASEGGGNGMAHWTYGQPVITVSDRSGYDMNEYEAMYSWGSYSGDEISMAYTQLQTCTWCIRIIDVDCNDMYWKCQAAAETGQYKVMDNANRVVATQCTIKVSRQHMNGAPSATWRQGVITHELGHCLGFEHYDGAKSYSIMSNADAGYPPAVYTPRTLDYQEMNYHYTIGY